MTINTISCNICNSVNVNYYSSISGFDLYFCNNCDVVFTVYPSNFNYDVFNRNYYSKNYLNNYIIREKNLKKRFIKQIQKIDSLLSGGKIIDIGSNNGLFLDLLSQHSKSKWDLIGIEKNNLMRKYGIKRNYRIKSLKSLSKLNHLSDYADCITCFDVLEHITDINQYLTNLFRLLKANGLLIIQMPNRNSILAYICKENWDWWSLPDHAYHFNLRSLSELLEKKGFVIYKTYTWEDEKDFINNIVGTIRQKFYKNLYFRKIVIVIVLYLIKLLFPIIRVIELLFNVGGLIVVYASK